MPADSFAGANGSPGTPASPSEDGFAAGQIKCGIWICPGLPLICRATPCLNPPARRDNPRNRWARYARQFRRSAKAAHLDSAYVDRCLAYARRLADQGLPIIFDQAHFSGLVGVDVDYLRRAANAPDRFYRRFEIAKRSGRPRTISAPLPTLKNVQGWILDEILAHCKPSRFAHAFGPGCSIRTNARFHLKQPIVVGLDIKDFFPSITSKRVYRIFRDLGYSRSVSGLLVGLTTIDNCLPQGASTSPALSEILSVAALTRVIAGFCMRRKWRYTRYADDLTFSGDLDESRLIAFVRRVLDESGFVLRDNKTRVMRARQRQLVTGVVVNQATHSPREFRRLLRQMAFYIHRHGLSDHMRHRNIEFANYRAHLLGKAHHARFLNVNDRDAKALIEVLTPKSER